jgi:hypothetical protein
VFWHAPGGGPVAPLQRLEAMRHRDYLFAERATIHDVVMQQRAEAEKAVADLPAPSITATSADELTAQFVDRFRLDVPVLDRSGINQLPSEEVDIDVSGDRGRSFREPGPHFVKGTALRIAIPFSGEQVLFRYGTSLLNGPIPGDVRDRTLVLTHVSEQPDPAAAKADFESRLNRIDSMLQMVRGPADEWNRQLPQFVGGRLSQRHAKLTRDQSLSLGYPLAPAVAPHSGRTTPPPEPERHDLFLSHASEDKESIARPLYLALVATGVTVWFDEAVLELGDSLRRKIDAGLARCRYGVVILSPRFLSKEWPQRELDGLVARETASGEKAILPIWHEMDRDTPLQHSPLLADRVAGRSEEGIPTLVEKIVHVLRR